MKSLRQIINSSSSKIAIFGINVYSERLLNRFNNISKIYLSDPKINIYKGIDVNSINDINEEIDLLIICSGGRINSSINLCKRCMGNKKIILVHYFELIKQNILEKKENLIVMNENISEEYKKEQNKFSKVHDLLEDKKSKFLYNSLIQFRNDLDITHLKDLDNLEAEQYFEEFLCLGDKPIFVDIGSFDGYTSQKFSEKYKNYAKIYAFEPETLNFIKTKRNLSKLKRVEIIKKIVSDKAGFASLSNSGSTSKVNLKGDENIEVTTIDNEIKLEEKNINFSSIFLKCDTEGFEMSVLNGAINFIRRYRPNIAFSCYHSPKQMWEIPLELKSIIPDSKLYIRHYTESIYETVCFLVPDPVES